MILDADNVPIDLRGEDFNVVVREDMQIGIPEEINHNDDGSYTVFLNAKYNYEQCKMSMNHSFGHVRDEDWKKDCVQSIEIVQHRKEVV